jgi:hypothetical protein
MTRKLDAEPAMPLAAGPAEIMQGPIGDGCTLIGNFSPRIEPLRPSSISDFRVHPCFCAAKPETGVFAGHRENQTGLTDFGKPRTEQTQGQTWAPRALVRSSQRSLGITQSRSCGRSSARFMSATSSRRCTVKMSACANGPKGQPMISAPRQPTLARHPTKSVARLFGSWWIDDRHRGEAGTMSRDAAQANILRMTARARFAVTGEPS